MFFGFKNLMKMKSIIILTISLTIILALFLLGSFGYLFTTVDNSSTEIPKISMIAITEKELQNQQVRNFKTDNDLVNQILSQCGLDKHCLLEQIQSISKNQSEKKLLEIISLTMGAYDSLGIWCHHQGHHIGEFLLEYYNGDVHLALSNVNQKCDSSLHHGIIENFLVQQIILNDVKPQDIQVSNACDIFEDRLINLECAHGMGHGLVQLSDYDLEWAANRCDEFKILELKQVCYRGVFMENVVSIIDGRGVYDNNDPYFPCNVLDDRHAQVCYQYHAGIIATLASENVFDSCDKIEPESLIKYCYMGVKPFLFNSVFYNNYEPIVETCSEGNLDYQTYCYIGIVIALVDWRGTEEGITFCKTIPEKFKTDCYDYLGKMIHDEFPDRVEEECSKAESFEYKEICKIANPQGLRILIT